MSLAREAPLVDLRTLGRLRELLGPEEFDALVRDSLVAYAAYCDVMLRPASRAAEIAAEAHKLRGSAGSLGLGALSSAAGRIESDVEAGGGGVVRLVHELQQTIVATREAIDGLGQTMTGPA